MHPRIQEVLDHLDANRVVLQRHLDAIPKERWSRRPADGSWSITDVVGHLALVEGRIGRAIARQVGDARQGGATPDPATSPVLGTLDAARWLDRSSAMVAPEPTLPPTGADADTALAAFESAHATLRTVFMSGSDVDMSQLIVPHPLYGPMNLYQLTAFAGLHEARHAAQIAAIATALTGA